MAKQLALLGLAFYVVFNAIIVVSVVLASQSDIGDTLWSLVGLGPDKNYPVAILILLGVLVFVYASWSVDEDIGDLVREEQDIEWLNEHPDAPELVLAPARLRLAIYRKGRREYQGVDGGGVETLLDDRVHRIIERQRDRSVRVSPDELRIIAETRTSRYGATARFASSLLLLLTVLGTFAGVKAALPGLIHAVSVTGGGLSGTDAITVPLRAVADAFGANSLALVGAIALGLMAQGLWAGRRNLLERLELVSDSLYGTAHHNDALDPLSKAIDALRDTAAQVTEVSGAIAGMEGGLSGLSEAFRDGFERFNERLVEVAEHQESLLHEKTSQELRELQRRISELAEVVEQNTRAYQGIVDTVGERSRESHEAMQVIGRGVESLENALTAVTALQAAAEQAARNVQVTLEALERGSAEMAKRMSGVAGTVESAQIAVAQIEPLLSGVSQRIAATEERAAVKWSEAVAEVGTQLEQVVHEVRGAAGRRSADGELIPSQVPSSWRDPEVAALLRRVAAAVEQNAGPSIGRAAVAQGMGVLFAIAASLAAYLVFAPVIAKIRAYFFAVGM